MVKVYPAKLGASLGPPRQTGQSGSAARAPPAKVGVHERSARERARRRIATLGSERASSTKREPHAGEAERHMRARSKSACHDAPMGAPRPRPTGTAVPCG